MIAPRGLLKQAAKTPKGGTKRAFLPGRTAGPGMVCKNFQKAGDVTNGAAGL
jgi:hypothetical protein